MANWKTVWEFKTAQYLVECQTVPSCDAPDWLEGEKLEAFARDVETGKIAYFDARVRVFHMGLEISADYLCACAYASVEEFITSHRDLDPMNRNCSIMRAARGENVVVCHYFPDMIRQAVDGARRTIRRLKGARVRAA